MLYFQTLKQHSSMRQFKIQPIVDTFFHHCAQRLRAQALTQLAFFIARQIALIISILLDCFVLHAYQPQQRQLFPCFLAIALIYNTLQLLQVLHFYCAHATQPQKLLTIAHSLHHSISPEVFNSLRSTTTKWDKDNFETDSITHIKFSNVFYDFQNQEKEDEVSPQNKQVRESSGTAAIKNALQKDIACYQPLAYTLILSSLAIFVFGVIIASISPVNQIQRSLLQLFLVTIVLHRPKIYAFLLAIIVAPFLLVLLCLYVSCFNTQNTAKLPKTVATSLKTLQKCSQCSVCFQDYRLDQQVVILPCSEMHVFHSHCIAAWTKIKPNCPICRQQLV